MVGDWVLFEGTPAKITGIRIWHEPCAQTNLHDIWFVTGFEPIPLTKEILEKNADSHLDERLYDIYCFYSEEDDHYRLVEVTYRFGRIEWTINGNEYGITEIKYVHELQHALRLCRIEKEIVL